ncbi:malate dehydrogenase glyoxysomal-like [Tripterygium wilfordii]|uniref:malate dehydrogenase n=1 Tax=Tripterygium wilfordii TaxID=458696 RepID=A0A7J7DGF2_TRIWF|nr:malate dehydrogenase glyoxysomal-like [Tripterygium wilfordii]
MSILMDICVASVLDLGLRFCLMPLLIRTQWPSICLWVSETKRIGECSQRNGPSDQSAGVPRKPGMTRPKDDLFNINAGLVKNLCEAIAKCCHHQSSTPRFLLQLRSSRKLVLMIL